MIFSDMGNSAFNGHGQADWNLILGIGRKTVKQTTILGEKVMFCSKCGGKVKKGQGSALCVEQR